MAWQSSAQLLFLQSCTSCETMSRPHSRSCAARRLGQDLIVCSFTFHCMFEIPARQAGRTCFNVSMNDSSAGVKLLFSCTHQLPA